MPGSNTSLERTDDPAERQWGFAQVSPDTYLSVALYPTALDAQGLSGFGLLVDGEDSFPESGYVCARRQR